MSSLIESSSVDSFTRLKGRFLEKANEICILPSGVIEAFRLAADPDCQVDKFARAIEQDVNLAVEVLKMANSPLFSAESPVSNLKQAAVRLGMRRCRNLIVSTCVCGMMKEMPLEVEWARDVLNIHSNLTATAATLINDEFGLGFVGEEYTAGLLHDFGRLAFAATLVDDFSTLDELSFDESDEILLREQELIGTDHCEFGSWFVESISFPSELVESVRWHHHSFGAASLKNQPLVSLIRTADHFANFVQREEPVINYQPITNEGLRELSRLSQRDSLVSEFASKVESFVSQIKAVECSDGGGI